MSANVALSDTFDQWRVKTNELLVMTQTDGMSNFIKTTDSTNSTSNTTGSIITAGGIGVSKSVVVGENLNVHGNIHANGNITSDGSLTLGDADTDNIVFNADVNSDIIPNTDGSFDIGNTSHRFSNAYFDDVEITSNVIVGDSISVSGSNTYVSSTNTFITGGPVGMTEDLSVSSNVIVGDSLSVSGTNAYMSVANAFINGTLLTTGDVSFASDATITSNATIGDSISVSGSNAYMSVTNAFITGGEVTVTGNSSFSANAIFQDTIFSYGAINFNTATGGSIESGGSTYAGDASITSNATIGDSLSVSGTNAYISTTNTFITSGNTTVTGNVSISANAVVSDTFSTANLSVSQKSALAGVLEITDTTDSVVSNTSGSLTTAGGVGILKSVTIGENLNVHGNIHANGNITADGSLTLGDADTDSVTFGADLASSIIPTTDSAYDLGNTTNRFANAYFDDVELTSNAVVGGSISVSGTNAHISTGNTSISSNTTFTGERQNVTSNVAISGTIDLSKRTIDGTTSNKDIIHENSLISFGGVNLVVTDLENTDDGVLLLQTGEKLVTEVATRARLESNTSGTTLSGKNIGLGHSINYAVGEGRNVLIMEKGVEPTFPVDGLGNKILPNTQAYLYSIVDKDGGSNKVHLYTMDAGGSETRLGSHNDSGEWEYFSRNIHTGKIVRINMERMIRKLEEITGEKFIEER